MVTMELVLFIVGALLGTGAVNSQECNREDLRRCRQDIIISLESQNSNTDKFQLEEQCRTLREDMDCVVEQTALCLREEEKNSNSDIIWKTWRYLGSFCDKFGNWWANACFQREDLKRCETLLPSNSRSIDNVACRGFVNFRDCVTSIVDSKCSSEDRSLLITYLVDRGQEKTWRCPKNQQLFLTRYDSAPLAADSRQTMMMADFHSLSDFSTCLTGLLAKDNRCKKKLLSDIDEAKNENDAAIKEHKSCCIPVQLSECVHDLTKEKCGEEAAKESKTYASKLLSSSNFDISNCKDYTNDTCSGSFGRSVSITSLILTLISAIFVGRF